MLRGLGGVLNFGDVFENAPAAIRRPCVPEKPEARCLGSGEINLRLRIAIMWPI